MGGGVGEVFPRGSSSSAPVSEARVLPFHLASTPVHLTHWHMRSCSSPETKSLLLVLLSTPSGSSLAQRANLALLQPDPGLGSLRKRQGGRRGRQDSREVCLTGGTPKAGARRLVWREKGKRIGDHSPHFVKPSCSQSQGTWGLTKEAALIRGSVCVRW